MSLDPKLPAQPYPLVDTNRLMTEPWYNSILLMARAVAALGPIANAATILGWGVSTGGARGAVNGGFTQVAAGAYSQGDTQVLINQVEVLSQRVAQLITDLETSKVLK